MGRGVIPQAQAVGGDATLGRHRGGFNHEQTRAAVE